MTSMYSKYNLIFGVVRLALSALPVCIVNGEYTDMLHVLVPELHKFYVSWMVTVCFSRTFTYVILQAKTSLVFT